MSFIMDVTIGEGEAVPPNTKFVKTWRIQNSGNSTFCIRPKKNTCVSCCMSNKNRVGR